MDAKAAPVFPRRHSETVLKSPSKCVGTAESNRSRNRIDGKIGGGQAAPGFIEPMALNEDARWLAKGVFEPAHKMAWRQARAPGQSGDGEIAIGIVRNPTGQFGETIARLRLKPQRL